MAMTGLTPKPQLVVGSFGHTAPATGLLPGASTRRSGELAMTPDTPAARRPPGPGSPWPQRVCTRHHAPVTSPCRQKFVKGTWTIFGKSGAIQVAMGLGSL